MKETAVILLATFFVWAGSAAQTAGSTSTTTAKKNTSLAKKSPPLVRKAPPAATKNTSLAKKSTVVPKKTTAYSSKKMVSNAKPLPHATSTKAKAPSKPAPRTYGQIEPAPDRYREIQQALAEKGYLRSEPSGRWDADSADALRRFQQEHDLESSGKLDSLSLIALGLGPKRTTTAQARPQ